MGIGKRSFSTRETKIIPRMIMKGALRMTAMLQALKANSPYWSRGAQQKDVLRLASQRSGTTLRTLQSLSEAKSDLQL